jgi:hypothetical protein
MKCKITLENLVAGKCSRMDRVYIKKGHKGSFKKTPLIKYGTI